MKKKISALLALFLLLSACGEPAASAPSGVESSGSAADVQTASGQEDGTLIQVEGPTTELTLEGDKISVSGPGAKVDGSSVTITQAGTFVVSGTVNDGQILVDAGKEDAVLLRLSGADITYTKGAPIAIMQAGNAYIELAEGTENFVTDGPDYTFEPGEDEPDAAIFSKDDLVLCGSGALTVFANYSMAVHGKDDLSVVGGNYNLTAVGDGLKGKDSVTISGGSVTVDAAEDGIQSNNDVDADKGTVTIREDASVTVKAGKDGIKGESLVEVLGGTLQITAQEDGLHATKELNVTGGNMTVDAGQDGLQSDMNASLSGGTLQITAVEDGINANSFTAEVGEATMDVEQDGIQTLQNLEISGGTIQITTGGGAANAPEHKEQFGFPGWFDTNSDQEETASAKGLKSDGDITVSGGTITLDCMDDALHCGGTLTVSDDADLTIATGDDGLHSDDTLNIQGGKIDITKCYEGLEAVFINISGGETALVASDDGLNAAGGTSADTDFQFMGPPGMGGQAETLEEATYYVNITGGKLTVDAAGDGLDSNGALFVSGGEVYVSGPSDSMNGGLDYTTTGQITGGTVMVAGASGMAQNFDSSSTQCSLMYTLDETIPEGSTVTLKDASGKVLAEAVMAKSFNNVVISTPDMKIGETYTLICGDVTVEAEMTDTITTLGSRGFGGPGGFGGGPGGGPGGPPGF